MVGKGLIPQSVIDSQCNGCICSCIGYHIRLQVEALTEVRYGSPVKYNILYVGDHEWLLKNGIALYPLLSYIHAIWPGNEANMYILLKSGNCCFLTKTKLAIGPALNSYSVGLAPT